MALQYRGFEVDDVRETVSVELAGEAVIEQEMDAFLVRTQCIDKHIEEHFTAASVHMHGIKEDHGGR